MAKSETHRKWCKEDSDVCVEVDTHVVSVCSQQPSMMSFFNLFFLRAHFDGITPVTFFFLKIVLPAAMLGWAGECCG